MDKLSCGCHGYPRPALEHNTSCPRRLGFWGAPPEWGVGEYGERRRSDDRLFEYTQMSWKPVHEDIKGIRRNKILEIEKNENSI